MSNTNVRETRRRCVAAVYLLIALFRTGGLPSCNHCNDAVIDESSCNSTPTLAQEWLSLDGTRKAVEQHFDCPGWYALKIEITNADKTKALAFEDRPVDQVRPWSPTGSCG